MKLMECIGNAIHDSRCLCSEPRQYKSSGPGLDPVSTQSRHDAGCRLLDTPAKLHYVAAESIHDDISSVAKVVDAMGNLDLDLGIRSCQSFVHRRSTTPVYRRPRPVELSSVIRRQLCSSAYSFAIDASRRGRQRS